LTKPEVGHFRAQGVPMKRKLKEFPVTEDALLPVGTSISVNHFVPGQYVDVAGITRGKGFQVWSNVDYVYCLIILVDWSLPFMDFRTHHRILVILFDENNSYFDLKLAFETKFSYFIEFLIKTQLEIFNFVADGAFLNLHDSF